jgi:K+-sensing histidine kinase KdpD
MGMPPQVRGRAFEPFFTTKAPVDGSGLGLSFVYGIVKQLDGYVWIDSTPGAGTTVRIDLPLVRDHAAPSEARVSDAAGLPPREQRELVAPGRAGAPARGVHA